MRIQAYQAAGRFPTGADSPPASRTQDGAAPFSKAITELYSGSSGTFAAADNMVSMRQGPLRSAEIYDRSTGRFATTGGLSVPRDRGAFALLADGGVLAAGGDDAGTCERYDPSAGVFQATAAMQFPRFGDTATALTDGRVLIIGGVDAAGNAVLQAERFRWTETAGRPAAGLDSSHANGMKPFPGACT